MIIVVSVYAEVVDFLLVFTYVYTSKVSLHENRVMIVGGFKREK